MFFKFTINLKKGPLFAQDYTRIDIISLKSKGRLTKL